MPLVFVHGVNNRDSAANRESQRARDVLFTRIALADVVRNADPVTVRNPYWGQYGAKFRWNHASVPHGVFQALGPQEALPLILLGQSSFPEVKRSGGSVPAQTDRLLVDLAHRSLEEAVDLLVALTADGASDALLADVGDFALRATAYAAAHRTLSPSWLPTVVTNDDFVTRLQAEVAAWQPPATDAPVTAANGWQSLGLGTTLVNALLDAGQRVRNAVVALHSTVGAAAEDVWVWSNRHLVGAVRDGLHPEIATFIGDVVEYVNRRGTAAAPGAIVREVAAALRQASNDRKPDDPYVIAVGHSMGGNILYDLLTAFCTDVSVDLLVTVGSQVGVFEEMKQFVASDQTIPTREQPKVAQPGNIGAWVNVFDPNDLLAFAAREVFDGVRDVEYVTGNGVLSAHGAYFLRPSFHLRLRHRIRELVR
jgi:hypothetical protein